MSCTSEIRSTPRCSLRERTREKNRKWSARNNAQEKPNTSGACTKLRGSGVACYARLSSRCWHCHGHQRELQDREDDTQNKGRINCNLENVATFFFRPGYQGVSGFEFVVRSIGCVHTSALCIGHATKCASTVSH